VVVVVAIVVVVVFVVVVVRCSLLVVRCYAFEQLVYCIMSKASGRGPHLCRGCAGSCILQSCHRPNRGLGFNCCCCSSVRFLVGTVFIFIHVCLNIICLSDLFQCVALSNMSVFAQGAS
jgi:hypothetical protein